MFINPTAKSLKHWLFTHRLESAYITLYLRFVSTGVKKASSNKELLCSKMPFEVREYKTIATSIFTPARTHECYTCDTLLGNMFPR